MIKFRYYTNNTSYTTDKNNNTVKSDDIVFVEDAKKIVTHGKEYSFYDSSVLNDYITSAVAAQTYQPVGNYITSGTQTQTSSNSAGEGTDLGINQYRFTASDGTVSYLNVQNGSRGATGADGAAAGFGTPTATVSNTTGTPRVTVTASGPDTAKVFAFSFSGLKGETGAAGSNGTNGTNGNNGVGIDNITRTSGNGAAGTTDTYTITGTDNSTLGTFTVYNGSNGTNGTNGTSYSVATSSASGIVPASTANKILRAGADGALYWGDDADTQPAVTSVVGQSGVVTAAQIADALTTAGYALTDNNTTYESKTAVSGGTDVSLVTTGEKYTWDNKGNGTVTSLAAGTGISFAASSAAGSNITDTGTISLRSGVVAAGTAGTSSATSGSTLAVPYITVDTYGRVTAKGTHTHTVSGFLTSHQDISGKADKASYTTVSGASITVSSDNFTYASTSGVTSITLAAQSDTTYDHEWHVAFTPGSSCTVAGPSSATVYFPSGSSITSGQLNELSVKRINGKYYGLIGTWAS